ncbi:MAG: SpoIIE family protein phosphatase [Planctomycetales bacterium]|nr:SpoIIE family protein phosphatase [Planctomycetales bacterium]
MAHLVSNDSSAVRHELTKAEYVLGRHPDCDIVVDAGAVSRQHARLFREGPKFFVEDMQSRNGTYVNGRMIYDRHGLSDGDQIRVCDVSFTFHQETSTLGSSHNMTVLVDDTNAPTHSTVWSKLDVTSEDSHLRFSASPEAKLQALLEITRSLGKSLSLDQVLPQVLNSLFKVFLQADRGSIILRDDRGNLIPRWTKVRRDTTGETIRISKTIVNEVISSKQAILSADAASDERFDMSESIADFHIRSLICAPLVDSDGDVFGVIQIDTKDQRKRFREEDLEVLGSVAVQAATAINNAQLHEQVVRQKELERELDLARDVQTGFLPKSRPTTEGYEFFDYYKPANHVGGDYYDYLDLPDGRLAIVVADVVGHGIAAALTMSKLSAAVKFSVGVGLSPAEMLQTLNANLTEAEFDGRYITVSMAILDPREHTVTISSAGHEAPIWKRTAGKTGRPGADISGYPLMVEDEPVYEQATIELAPGDVVAFFTDGLADAMNDSGEQFGMNRVVKHMKGAKSAEVGREIIADVAKFVGGKPSFDDMCLVCVSRTS